MTDELVLREKTHGGRIVVLTLNRPEKRNALNIPLLQSLVRAVEQADSDEQTRVIVLRGAGAVFCAGLDLAEARDETRSRESGEWIAKALAAISGSRAVTIAAIHGAAVAGGAGLMSACDFVVAASDAKIGYPEVRRGLVAGLVMTFLHRQVRDRDARELLILGENINAERAREMGLVNYVTPAEAVPDTVRLIAMTVLKGAPGAIERTKSMMDQLHGRPIADDLRWALGHHASVRASDEAKEGIAAFNEKRSPAWEPEADEDGGLQGV